MTTTPTIIVVMGVSGSGKTLIGTKLAQALGYPFLEGDTLHSPANVEKMSHGIPLTDADRAPWLAAIHAEMQDAFAHGRSLVVACSALKRSYRAVLDQGLPVTWIYLKGTADLIASRMRRRRGHYMKVSMLASQFDALEEPDDAIVAEISQPPDAIVEQILANLRGSGSALAAASRAAGER